MPNEFRFDKATHTYWLNGVQLPSVTEVLEDMGLIDTRWYTQADADFGQMIHDTTAMHDQGVLEESTLDPMLQPFLVGWKLFLAATKIEIIHIEKPFYDPTYMFAGTPDRNAIWDGLPCVPDIKTGVPLPWHKLQTAAYAMRLCDLGSSGVGYARRLAVYLNTSGTYKMIEHDDPGDASVFLAFLAARNWKLNNGVKLHDRGRKKTD